MPKTSFFCATNQFGINNTNVVRDDQTQFVYYDPGIGTLPGPGLVTRVGKFLSKAIDLAFATGLDRNVEKAYTTLMNNWEPGDQVYLFGFSRGSYTARVVAALLYHVGLLPRGSENLIPYALRLLRMARTDNRNLGDKFRETFARPIGNADRRFSVHFVGLWDTVSSVGWFWEPAKFRYTATNPGIAIVRHAISIDERRAFFRQNRFYARPARLRICNSSGFRACTPTSAVATPTRTSDAARSTGSSTRPSPRGCTSTPHGATPSRRPS